ncbi:hypothetical protein OKW28_007103 [Paraburkholderia sp. 40]
MRSLSQQTCWSDRPSREWRAGLRHTYQCADLCGRPTTVDPRDSLVLYGVHAVQKAIQLSVRSRIGISGYRTTPNTPPNKM